MSKHHLIVLFLLFIFSSSSLAHANELPDGFVYITDFVPNVEIEVRYYSIDNFVGKRIDGYEKPVAILTKQAAVALSKVQAELELFGLGLKIFDSYRPQRAVNHFVRWAKDLSDVSHKDKFYPFVEKRFLFRDGYIASKSGHSRGSTLDITLVSTVTKHEGELDMGSPWDFFDKKSWPSSKEVSSQQRANRMLLQKVMIKHGFKSLKEEWWHFTLKDEPFPETYFRQSRKTYELHG